MNDQEFISQLDNILTQFPQPRDRDWVIKHMLKEVEKAYASLERYKKYFQTNKQKLYAYNREYRNKKRREKSMETAVFPEGSPEHNGSTDF